MRCQVKNGSDPTLVFENCFAVAKRISKNINEGLDLVRRQTFACPNQAILRKLGTSLNAVPSFLAFGTWIKPYKSYHNK
jgi:hypothetical protein